MEVHHDDIHLGQELIVPGPSEIESNTVSSKFAKKYNWIAFIGPKSIFFCIFFPKVQSQKTLILSFEE